MHGPRGSDGRAAAEGSADGPATLVTAEEPALEIGATTGEEAYLLHGVTDALRLADGTVVVANCGSSELRFFDEAGRWLRSAGGRGDGPGEFTELWKLLPAGGDTVGASDELGGRLTLFGPDGSVHRIVPLPPSWTRVQGRLADGAFVGFRENYGLPPDARAGQVVRGTSTLLLFDPVDGSVLDSVAGLPGQESSVERRGDRLVRRAARLARTPRVAVSGDRIYVSGQDEDGIRVFGPDLEPRAGFRTRTEPEPVTEEVERAWEDSRELLGPPDGILPAYGSSYAPRMPAHGDLIAGSDGRLWVEDPVRPGVHPLVWTAYEDGEAVARARVPARFFPFEFGDGWVLGVRYDELTVARVQLWPLVPGPHSGETLPPRDAEPPGSPRCSTNASR